LEMLGPIVVETTPYLHFESVPELLCQNFHGWGATDAGPPLVPVGL
jgi:hypothetical protein